MRRLNRLFKSVISILLAVSIVAVTNEAPLILAQEIIEETGSGYVPYTIEQLDQEILHILKQLGWTEEDILEEINTQGEKLYNQQITNQQTSEAPQSDGTAIEAPASGSEGDIAPPSENENAGTEQGNNQYENLAGYNQYEITAPSGDITYFQKSNPIEIFGEDCEKYKDARLGDIYAGLGEKIWKASAIDKVNGDVSAEIARRQALLDSGALTGKTRINYARNTEKLAQSKLTVDDFESLAPKAKVGSRLFSCLGMGLTAYGVYNDAKDLWTLTGDGSGIYNEHTFFRYAEIGLLGADALLGVATIGITAIGLLAAGTAAAAAAAAAAPFLGLIALGVGIATMIVHSQGFAQLANESGSMRGFFYNLIDAICSLFAPPDGVGMYKPNIYIYGAGNKEINVRFTHASLLTKTIPEYVEEWKVTMLDDDSHMDSDGNEYDYLFYESITSTNFFDMSQGFYIDKDSREDDIRNILGQYGFNEQEINDFIEYWDDRLDEVDYIMYPQLTEIVDEAMPIVVLPEPEKVYRMWFVFDDVDSVTETQTQEPEIIPIYHDGYTLVEWGGTVVS